MPYRWQYACSVAVAVALALIGAIQLANPDDLGISPRVVAWTQVLVPGLGILAGILPSVRRPPSDNREGMD